MFAQSSDLRRRPSAAGIAALALVLVLGLAAPAPAAPGARPRPAAPGDLVVGAVVDAAKAAGDSILLMGPQGSGAPYVGDFEDGLGGGDWHGWTSRDFTTAGFDAWRVDAYHAVSGAYSAWCGRADYPSCSESDPAGGYGNNWDTALEWRGQVADPGQPCQVDVAAVANLDTETGYDFVHLTVLTAAGAVDLWTGDGTATALPIAAGHHYAPGDYVGDGGDEVAVRFRFSSDGAYSDEDCLHPTAGALQLDDVVVTLSNGPGAAHDFEDGTFGPFTVVQPVGVGDFAQLMNNLEDVDPCASNYSWQVVFIDDGIVVPGTGGSPCINWCYGPNGYIVNTTGGLVGPAAHLHNGVLSPAMAWPDPAYDGASFDFTVYAHEDLSVDAPGIFVNWSVRSTASGDPAALAATPWENRTFLYWGLEGYTRLENYVSDLLVPGRTHVQVKFEVMELGWIWGWNGDDGYPAPYFDHARFTVFTEQGPALTAREIELAQDAFPADGTVDPADLGGASVRFDMARNISPATHLRIDPGDSLVIEVGLVRHGSVLAAPPRLHWRLARNPLFDAERTAGLPDEGWAWCDTVRAPGGGVITNRWSADLPDSGFLFPGDVLHYYFSATDAVAGDLRTAILPADTSGFADFADPLAYDPGFTMRALPTVHSVAGGVVTQPGVLFWNDNGNRGGRGAWHEAFAWGQLRPGLHYDIYCTKSPQSGVGNGLGSRASTAQLAGYDDLVYTSGDLALNTLGNGDFDDDPSPDVQLLAAWLALGGRDAFMTGDGLASDLARSGGDAALFLQQHLGLALVAADVRPLIGNQVAPGVLPMPGTWVFARDDAWIAAGGCPSINAFDAVTTRDGTERLAEFATPWGGAGGYLYSAATHRSFGGSRVISLPYDLMYVEPDPPGAVPSGRNLVFYRVGTELGFIRVIGAEPELPPAVVFAARHWPNPFNPQVTIECALPRPGHLTVKVFDLRGRLVRTLQDGVVERSLALAWDGRDDGGARAASGVYFYEARLLGEVRVGRMLLLK